MDKGDCYTSLGVYMGLITIHNYLYQNISTRFPKFNNLGKCQPLGPTCVLLAGFKY